VEVLVATGSAPTPWQPSDRVLSKSDLETAGSVGRSHGPRVDLHGRRHPGCKDHALGHLIEVNGRPDAL
jgi:hypothetical protein